MTTAPRALLASLIRESGVGRQLAQGAAGSVLITIIKTVLQLLVSIFLARLLAPAGYGRYAFAVSLVKVLGAFAMLGLPGLLTREIAVGEAHGQWPRVRGLLRHADITVALALSVLVGGVGTTVFLWPNLSGEFRLTLAFALAYLVFDALSQLRGARLMGFRRVVAGQAGILCIQPALLLASVLVLAFAIGATLDSARAMLLTAAASLAVLGLNGVLVSRYSPTQLRTSRKASATPHLLRSAIPFAAMTGLFLINSQIDLVMLGLLSSSSNVGLYRVSASGAVLLPFVLAAVNPVLAPTLARLHALEDHSRLRRAARAGALVSLLGATPILFGYVVFGKFIIAGVFGPVYVAAWLPLVILSIGQFVNAAMGPVGMLLNMTGHEHDTLWVLATSTILNIVLNAILIPRFGTEGAASATAFSLIVWNVALAVRVRRRFGYYLTPLAR